MRELRPIRETPQDYEAIEQRIKDAFFALLYRPLHKALIHEAALTNALSALIDALHSGRVTYAMGRFRGRFSAQISRELKALGATWEKKTAAWRLVQADMTPEVRAAVNAAHWRFAERLRKADRQILQVSPAEIAGKIQLADLFEDALWRTEREFRKTVATITVPPELTPERRQRLAAEWQDNMSLTIKGFADAEIQKLRRQVQESALAGNRYESMVKAIQTSYDTTRKKARFLARQETALLMTTYKKARYLDAGLPEYRWRCVVGSPLHPVRPAHKALDGKICRWDDPPITSEPGQPIRRNNAGADYNCRCTAIPIVRFQEKA